jgi:hypothetical protein
MGLGGDGPCWQHPGFVHTFVDPFLEPQPRKMQAPPLPDPADSGIKESAKEQAARLAAKPNLTCFPLAPTVEFVSKLLNNVHGLIPKSLEGVLDGSEEAVILRRVRFRWTWRFAVHNS